MADAAANAAALTAAITALTNAIALIRAPAPAPQVFDPFQADVPYNLASRLGSQAYADVSAPLDDIWDGTVNSFPSFVVALSLRAEEAKWNAAAPNGILDINGKNMLTEYHSITEVDITTARTNRVDTRAIQNSRAMFQCVKSSIKGDVRDTIFTQAGNLPTHTDGNTLFKKITTFTTVSSLQLSLLSFNSILLFNPLDHGFNISIINSKLMHLFVLAATQHRKLNEQERIQHTLNVYAKILQPETWAQWIRNKVDEFEEGNVTVCQDFMNSAVIKYNKIAATHEGFKGSVHTVQEDIISLLATKQKAKPDQPKRQRETDDDEPPRIKKTKYSIPPFIKHFQDATTGTRYKIGDSKVHNGKTFYFCDATNHRDKIKWHTHTHTDCRVRKKWLKTQEGGNDTTTPPEANVADVDTEGNAEVNNPEDNSNTSLTGLLASAMNLVGDNDILRDFIAEAINNASS